mgnify:CR=1 FL=1
MKLRPFGKRLVVRRLDPVTKTPGGIHLPDQAQEKPRRGKVLAIGDVADIRDGDVVVFSAYAGNEIELDGEKYLLLTDDDVLAVVE